MTAISTRIEVGNDELRTVRETTRELGQMLAKLVPLAPSEPREEKT